MCVCVCVCVWIMPGVDVTATIVTRNSFSHSWEITSSDERQKMTVLDSDATYDRDTCIIVIQTQAYQRLLCVRLPNKAVLDFFFVD